MPTFPSDAKQVRKEDLDNDQRVSLHPPRHHQPTYTREGGDEEAPYDWRNEGGEAKLGENNTNNKDSTAFSSNGRNDSSTSDPSLAEFSTHQLSSLPLDATAEKKRHQSYTNVPRTRVVDNRRPPSTAPSRNQRTTTTVADYSDFDVPADAVMVEGTLPEVDVVAVVEQRATDGMFTADDIAREVIRQLRAQDAKDTENDLKSPSSNTTTTTTTKQSQYAPNNGTSSNNIENNVDDAEAAQKRRKLKRWIGVGSAVAVLIVVLIVVIVAVSRPSSDTPAIAPTGPPTVSQPGPSTVPATGPPTVSQPYQPTPTPQSLTPPPTPTISTQCGDIPCSSDVTVVELLNGASNHTLLAAYLKRDVNSELLTYLSSDSNNVTLFAPTDASFQALQPPHSYYLTENNLWSLHLWRLLGSNILDEAVNASQIFKEHAFQTHSIFSLTVNPSSSTIENGASIVTPDIKASNGYIQVPDQVIFVLSLRTSLLDSFGRNDITKFLGLIQASGLEDKLQQILENGLTVFVPTNDAFDLLDASVTALLNETTNTTFLTNFVLYHMIDINVHSVDPPNEFAYVMLNGVSAWFTNNNPNSKTMVNSATIITTYYASNGFFQIIDKVLLPPNLGELLQITTEVTTDFNTSNFYEIVNDHANLGGLFNSVVEGHPELGNYYSSDYFLTVFAPIESAFTDTADESLFNRLLDPEWLLHLQNLCLHHFTIETFGDSFGQKQLTMLSGFDVTFDVLVQGSQTADANETIDGVHVEVIPGRIQPNLIPFEGVIRFIDQVLLPPWVSQSVNDTILATPDIADFSLVVQLSNLQDQLNGTADTPLTVFAPNNDAGVTSNNTLSPQELVLRHTFLGNLYEASLNSNQTVVSLSNETFSVERVGNDTYIGGALIVQANILAANGVIHVIDGVL